MKIFFDALSEKPTISIGTQAYIISGLHILEKKFPDSEYVMISSNPVVDESYLKDLPYHITLIKRAESRIGTMIQFRKIVNNVDAVVSSWGDAYITSPPYKLFRKAFFLKKRNVPLILFTSSIGPFNGGIKDYIAFQGLKMFDFISVRDAITYNYLKKYPFKSLKLIHDTAFVLEPASDTIINTILTDAKIGNSEYIALNISVLLYNRFEILDKDYISIMVNLIEWFISEFKLPILLIPHQIFPKNFKFTQEEYESQGGDDRYAIQLVMNSLNDNKNVFCLNNNYSPMELKGVIKRSKIFIGGRMHSIIGSISQCVPSLIMQYSHKSIGMMKLLNMEEYVWDILESEKLLKSKIQKLWNEKQNIRNELEKEMPGIFKSIYSLGDEIEKCLTK